MNKVTPTQFKEWIESLYDNESIFLWGANCDIITKQLIDSLYRKYGCKTFNKAYYYSKLALGKGKIGADSSGAFFNLSGEDRTVREYYDKCIKTDVIAAIPKDKVCLVFSGDFTHMGAYLGNGTTIEMRNSKVNMYKESLKRSRWTYYGIPDFVDYGIDNDTLMKEISVHDTIVADYQNWLNNVSKYANIKITGVFDEKTKYETVRHIQHIANLYFGKNIAETGLFDITTRDALPSFELLKLNDEAFHRLTYTVNVYLYSLGYPRYGLVDGTTMTDIYNIHTKLNIKKFQTYNRGLEVDGMIEPSTLYAMFS